MTETTDQSVHVTTTSIDWDDLESQMDIDTNALILCNPQNPTGNVWSKEDLLRLGRLCLERRWFQPPARSKLESDRPGRA